MTSRPPFPEHAFPQTLMKKHAGATLTALTRILPLLACLMAPLARADEYADISQLLRAGKLAEAQVRVDRHLASRPRDPQMRLYRGVIQRESGRQADAIVTFTRLSEDYPQLPEPYNNLAVIYAAQGHYDKARLALEKALRTNPSYATAHDNLGNIYARLASQAYSKALQMDEGAAPSPQPRLAMIRDLSNPLAGAAPVVVAAAAPEPAPAPKPAAAPAPRPAPVAAVTPPPAPAAPVAKPAATPAAPPKAPAAPPAASAAGSQHEVEQAVRAWARAWADKNMAQYLAAYSKDFATPGGVSRSAWEQDRQLRITSKSRISVNLLELQVTVKDNRAVAKFRQDYKADALAILSRKTLELVRSGDRWLIVKESSGG